MKPAIILLTALLLYSPIAFGQKTNATKDSLNSMHHYPKFRENCTLSSVGYGFLTVAIIAGVPLAVGDILGSGSPNSKTTQAFEGASVIDCGFFIVGGVCLYLGHLHQRNHYERFSLVGKGNQLGIAYNF